MMLRNLMILTLLLGVAGCGCTDDDIPLSTGPDVPLLVVKAKMPAIPVPPPRTDAEPCKIDVMFVLDDSDDMNNQVLGIIPNNPGDDRTRSQAAQAIMRNLQAMVQARIDAAYAEDGLPAPQVVLDFAFGVSRFEDFGGSFTSLDRRIGDVDDVTNPDNDQDARPFILNMPLLREKHPQFADRFSAAMARQAPGDGNPYYFPPHGARSAPRDGPPDRHRGAVPAHRRHRRAGQRRRHVRRLRRQRRR